MIAHEPVAQKLCNLIFPENQVSTNGNFKKLWIFYRKHAVACNAGIADAGTAGRSCLFLQSIECNQASTACMYLIAMHADQVEVGTVQEGGERAAK
jgi:hypothetical protein